MIFITSVLLLSYSLSGSIGGRFGALLEPSSIGSAFQNYLSKQILMA
jgi:hypothetical protein